MSHKKNKFPVATGVQLIVPIKTILGSLVQFHYCEFGSTRVPDQISTCSLKSFVFSGLERESDCAKTFMLC